MGDDVYRGFAHDLKTTIPAPSSAQVEGHIGDDLRLYSILRTDITMSQGKANAQCGHAYVAAAIGALGTPEGDAYARLIPGTKICLDGGSLQKMQLLIEQLSLQGIPCFPIIDRDHVELPDFDGSPILTAIGLGPFTRADTPRALRKLKLFKGLQA
ncbi:hypothetical protein LCGC14_0044620 [marine sediment metagenome]|mgnify:CR=1 FL=1|uniref:peptidyl-tRNA hydrolase n=2 Tax=root TaxID=1 RepID=A0A7V1FPG2_9RHOB|nr:peptidyl-tRNA hydrolase [Sulfitobacter litoralis]HDZ53507.1 hypothetical protein [Sulfitobacter litoralis]